MWSCGRLLYRQTVGMLNQPEGAMRWQAFPYSEEHKRRVLLGYLYDTGQLDVSCESKSGMGAFILGFVFGVTFAWVLTLMAGC